MSYGDASGGGTCAEQAQAGYVIMFADVPLLAGLAAPMTLVSWRSHRVKRVVTCASAADAMGLSEATAQGDCVRALWSEVVLGLSLREWRERKDVPPLMSVTDSKGNYDHLHNETVGPSEDRWGAIDQAIIREDLSRPQMFLRWVDGKAQVADALTKLHGDGDCCELCAVKHSPCWSRQTSRKTRAGKGTESHVTFEVAGACGRNVDTCDTDANRDLT